MDILSEINIGSILGSAVSIAIGFGLSVLKDYFDNRTKIYLSFVHAQSYEEGIDGIKHNPSGYVVEFYNYGRNPIMIENITLDFAGHRSVIDSPFIQPMTIAPCKMQEWELSNQDFDNIRYWHSQCKKKMNLEELTKIKVTIRLLSKKKLSQDLDISMIELMSYDPTKSIR